ncbi:putative peptidase [Oxobacter pfennigii]|uniref:Putative peptidase n=1 Tax=Oxobacter pfennigii TaxID=36849 RepID=A0A0P8W3E4_9CLOT|nr:Xaa-Pro peptidase family protein [Oxobacter pfennigii]KPU43110.1 putative peptidase [Oxobacter pfennigii]
MKFSEKIDRLAQLMVKNNADVLIIGTSSDMEYITGKSSFICERFKALFILSDGRFFYISPELYYEETREVFGGQTDIFVWSDSEGFLPCLEKANIKYGLKGKTIGVNDAIRAVDMLDMKTVLDMNFINGVSILEELRVVKTQQERDYLRKASLIADEVAAEIVKYIRPGITEKDIGDKIIELFFEKGAEGLSFEPIVASGPNSSKPHYVGNSRVIEDTDIIVLDFGCKYKGYCSDMSRTVFVGEPTKEQKKIYSIVLEANKSAESYVKAGVTARDTDLAARKVIRDAGYGECFLNRTGHGIGTAVHEAPYIREDNRQILKDGMSFSIEPGIYIPGRFGMRIEDIVLIHNGSGEILNKFTKEMIIIK